MLYIIELFWKPFKQSLTIFYTRCEIMIRRLLVKIIKLIVFVCIVLYTAFLLSKMLGLEDICPAINNFLAAIAAIPIPGVGTVGGVVALIVGALTLSGAFDGDE